MAEINGFECSNIDKLDRVLNGTVGRAGAAVGGLGESALEETPEQVLAQYDKLGGLITRNGDKVKTGCFWDFKNNKAIAKPKVVLVYRVNGAEVEVADGEEAPLSVRAAKQQAEEAAAATDDGEEAPAPKKKAKAKK